MKKAFTLIELLVVIAIIAILAAILFPVFAQAKAAAKKAAGISNQKQIGLGIVMYGADADDMFPRNDDCVLNSSLNPALNIAPAGSVANCGTQPQFRVNHFAWQKWTQPYVKNVQLYFNTSRGNVNGTTPFCSTGTWSQCGQLTGSYLLNTAFTGQLNTWGDTTGTRAASIRNSWLGGSMTSLPNTSSAGILMESGNLQIGVVPVAYATGPVAGQTNITAFPPAIREVWAFELGRQTGAYNPAAVLQNQQHDEARAAFGGVIVGHADGSAKFYPYGKFLALTPTAAEYGVPATPSFGFNTLNSANRGFSGGTITMGAQPNLLINYPLWGLGQ